MENEAGYRRDLSIIVVDYMEDAPNTRDEAQNPTTEAMERLASDYGLTVERVHSDFLAEYRERNRFLPDLPRPTAHDCSVAMSERHYFRAECSCGFLGSWKSRAVYARAEAQRHEDGAA